MKTALASRGMVTSPHHLASQSGLAVLRDGGTAVEATIATAAALSAVYPHMTGIGGDGLWLIAEPGRDPVAIRAAGWTGAAVDAGLYRGRQAIPTRGPLAANTVAGAIEGWRAALAVSAAWQPNLPLERILADAIHYAETGAIVSNSQAELTGQMIGELAGVPGFAATFLDDGAAPRQGARRTNPALANTFRRLASAGLEDFYSGAISADIAADLAEAGSPLTAGDFADYRAQACTPLSLHLTNARLFNHPPPSQGIAALMILGLFDRLGVREADGFDHVHGLVEATKLAFTDRDRHVGDPARMQIDPDSLLQPAYLDALAAHMLPDSARPWGTGPDGGDTVWLGAIDGEGRATSYIQSIYHEFGSGVVLAQTGIIWQNRGSSFSLEPGGPRAIGPRRLPFHTLNPAMAQLHDGRLMTYGTMGGDGQPQTQAAIFSRYAMFGGDLQDAVSAPRWLLGRRWADEGLSLKLECRFDPQLIEALRAAGHDVEIVAPFSDLMGHAGALVRHSDGMLEGASDPRSDGSAAGW